MDGRGSGRVALGALAVVLLGGPRAEALVVARVTRHGYILVDEPAAERVYRGRASTGDVGLLRTTADVTEAVTAVPGAPPGDLVAILQTEIDIDVRAAYLPVRNTLKGLGGRTFGGPVHYDDNPVAGTRFPVTGAVFLNALEYLTHPAERDFSRTRVCPEEFAHRFGVHLRLGSPDTEPGGPALEPDALLGRQRSHWSYFLNTGGSPMEGNRWEEVEPGVFRTRPATGRFSPLDLYLMGLLPAEAVPDTFLIAEPDTLGRRTYTGEALTRESPTERSDREVVVRGRRVNVSIQDIIHANGERLAPEGAAPDGPDLPVVWVLLARPERVTPALATAFDQAVERCATGFFDATGGRARLVSRVSYEGMGAGTYLARTAPPDAGQALPEDASEASEVEVPPSGGVTCATTPTRGRGEGGLTLVLAALLGWRASGGRARRALSR